MSLLLATLTLLLLVPDRIIQAVPPTSGMRPEQAGGAVITSRQQVEAQTAFYQGLNSLKLERHDEALAFFQQAINLNPEFAEAHLGLGMVYQIQFKYKRASESYAEAIRLRPSGLQAYFLKAEVDIGRGQAQQAEETSLRAVQLSPNSPEAHFWLGYARDTLDKNEEALKSYNQALQINPKYAPAHTKKGKIYGLQNRNQEALASYQLATESDPRYGEAHDYLGRLYIKLKKYSLARAEIQTLTELKDPNAKLVERQLLRAEKLDAAQSAIKLRPNDPLALCALGMALMDGDPWRKDNRFQQASELFQKAVRIKPNYAEAHWGLGQCYIELKDDKSAQREYVILQRLDKGLASKLAQMIKEGTSQGRMPSLMFQEK